MTDGRVDRSIKHIINARLLGIPNVVFVCFREDERNDPPPTYTVFVVYYSRMAIPYTLYPIPYVSCTHPQIVRVVRTLRPRLETLECALVLMDGSAHWTHSHFCLVCRLSTLVCRLSTLDSRLSTLDLDCRLSTLDLDL